MLLEGRSIVITGAGRGIGRATAEMFSREGGHVIVSDIDGPAAEAVAQTILGSGGQAVAVTADVSREDDVQACVDAAVANFGGLDVMINNAGVPRNAMLTEMSLEVFESVIDVHLRGAWLGTRAAARVMCEAGSGSIINMSSMSGLLGFALQTNYSAAKAGIVGLTKSAAKDVGPFGVRVNAIAPGTIRTERTGQLDPAVWESKLAGVALGREGTPDELASAALFLASDMSSYVTAVVLEVAGGRM